MAKVSDNARSAERMKSNDWSGPRVEPYEVRGHWLLCAVCRRGGCKTPPPGCEAIDPFLEAMWAYPNLLIRVGADMDVVRAHFYDVYADRGAKPLPTDFQRRRDDYVGRFKDLTVCRVLGIYPNSVLPAHWVYNILFRRKPTLDGLCRLHGGGSKAWPECPHADKGYYEKIAGEGTVGLEAQTRLGEDMDGRGVWAMVRPRTKQDMNEDKQASAKRIGEQADRLFIRPNHLLCIIGTIGNDDPLIQDNLVELRRRMEGDPDIPVTLVEGCCMVCDSCNVYHPDENVCYHTHVKNPLRDLMILEALGLPPGATLPARELYQLVYERIDSLTQICGWGDELNTAPFWAPCGNYKGECLDRPRQAGWPDGKTGRDAASPKAKTDSAAPNRKGNP